MKIKYKKIKLIYLKIIKSKIKVLLILVILKIIFLLLLRLNHSMKSLMKTMTIIFKIIIYCLNNNLKNIQNKKINKKDGFLMIF